MHLAFHLLLLLVAPLAVSQGQSHPGHKEGNLTNSSHQETLGPGEGSPSLRIVPSNTDFALHLYHLMAFESPSKNIFFSPLSISAALAMLSLGARAHTRTQILQGLGFNLTEMAESDIHLGFRHLLRTLSLATDTLEIHMGSALFLSRGVQLLPKFLNDTMAFYESQVFHTNFHDSEGAAQLINNHVMKETQGKIVNLASKLSKDTILVLVNFIYFKALWEKPFSRSKTTLQDFYVDENTIVQVPMMGQDGQYHWYLHDRYLPCSVLRMNYDGDVMALFILPDRGKMKQVEEVLTPEMLVRWNNLLQKRVYFYKKLELHLPKFSMSGSYELGQILPKLGFTELLSERANFSGITETLNLKMSKSFHKAILEVDEIGTKAAAVTNFSIIFKSARRNLHVLRFNRPFLVVIFSTKTQSILFLGKVVNPTKS
ncbi:kallistatin [Orycteropus afer afer]|uniref:Kallistatin n=1 Tax=Orycteropus afer afer TaxID=1230840 RepID=A0A8B7A455_ORYAF|nr:kallistatin [Orycteropus afer afer]